MQLQGIRQGFGCQGMTHNNALKTRWMRSRSSQIDSIFLRVCALGFPSLLGLPNLKMHASKLLPAASYCYWICHSWRPRQFMKMSLSCFYFCFCVRIEKRSKYSRRRAYNDDADIDYINERNAKFNKKAERFYGKYTAEIKQNLERGTAV